MCGGGTGHAEAVLIEFDPAKISYGQLLEIFWKNHSPTSARKGQYRSAVFAFGAAQAEQASLSRDEVAKRLGKPVLTEIAPAERFWMAEDYHQQYFGDGALGSCPTG